MASLVVFHDATLTARPPSRARVAERTAASSRDSGRPGVREFTPDGTTTGGRGDLHSHVAGRLRPLPDMPHHRRDEGRYRRHGPRAREGDPSPPVPRTRVCAAGAGLRSLRAAAARCPGWRPAPRCLKSGWPCIGHGFAGRSASARTAATRCPSAPDATASSRPASSTTHSARACRYRSGRWTTNPTCIDCSTWGVDALISNRPDVAVRVRNEFIRTSQTDAEQLPGPFADLRTAGPNGPALLSNLAPSNLRTHGSPHVEPRCDLPLGALGSHTRHGSRRSVHEEVRENLIRKLRAGDPLFTGIVGYDDTVIPQLVNALLSQHNFILLGLRGQAKTRLLRALVTLLDEQIPVMAGCEINDDPLAPICSACRSAHRSRRRCHADCLAGSGVALRREARHARRDHRGHGRRHRPDQGGALRASSSRTS